MGGSGGETGYVLVAGDFQKLGWENLWLGKLDIGHEGECSDRSMEAREIVGREGLTYQDKFGNPRKHPAVDIELNSKLVFSRLIKTLGLPTGEKTGPIPGTMSHKKKG